MKKIFFLLIAIHFLGLSTAFAVDWDEAMKTRIYYDNYAVHTVPTEDGIGLKMLELLGPDQEPMKGEVVIMQHGYSQSWNAFYQLAEAERAKGNRVFIPSWRGHGQQPYQSVGLDGVNPEVDSRMTYDRIVAFDVPALVNYVFNLTGRKVHWLGHSMGGMQMILALAGVTYDKTIGRMAISKEARIELKSKLASVTTLGSPVHFRAAGRLESVFLKLQNLVGINLDKSQDSESIKKVRGVLSQHIYNSGRIFGFFSAMMSPWTNLLNLPDFNGLINFNRMKPETFAVMQEFMGSKIPKIFSRSIDFFLADRGYSSADGRIDYAKASMEVPEDLQSNEPKVARVTVATKPDLLATYEHQIIMAKNHNHPLITMENDGHANMTVDGAAEVVSRVLDLQYKNAARLEKQNRLFARKESSQKIRACLKTFNF